LWPPIPPPPEPVCAVLPLTVLLVNVLGALDRTKRRLHPQLRVVAGDRCC